ncbi:MAG TPA: radical SAM protein [Aggregatilineales bacterium]|nr:radical SAM protein [Aggregatilineales bacterium]
MVDLLFGQSYYLRFDPKLYAAMQPYPPLGTLYAASVMRQDDYSIAVFDAMLASSEGEWAAALERHQPRFAVLFEDNFNYLSKMCLLRMREAAFTMIGMAAERGATVIVCGADATDHTAQYLGKGVSYVIRGEGEESLRELVSALSGRTGQKPEDIGGLSFVNASGELTQTLPRPALRDLDSLPFPAWDLVDRDRYRAIWMAHHGYYSINMVTTRGCPYSCNWCAKPIWGQRYNVRSPENVVAEIHLLKDLMAPDHLWFADDIFGLKPGWVQRFADLVQEANLKIPFKSLNRADLLCHEDTVPALKKAGADTIWIGAESGSQKILDAMDKGTQIEDIYDAARRLQAAGIRVGFFLQFGYLGETRQDIEKTIQMVRDLMPDDIGISVSYPLPGTKFYERVQAELGPKANWQDSDDLAMLYHGPYSTEFYRQLHTVIHKEYRARKTWRRLRDLRPWRPHDVRQIGAMVFHTLTLPAARARLDALERRSPSDTIRLEAAT